MQAPPLPSTCQARLPQKLLACEMLPENKQTHWQIQNTVPPAESGLFSIIGHMEAMPDLSQALREHLWVK